MEKSDIKFCVINVQGLIGHRYNKLNTTEFKQLFAANDIFLFSETSLNEHFDYNVDNFSYFILHRTLNQQRAVCSSGGLIIYQIK